jgi:quinol monooxygenase YgiN
MFGTTAVLRPRPGQEAAVVGHFDHWWRDRAPKVSGVLLGTLSRRLSKPAELLLTVAFASKSAFETNFADPEQQQWFEELTNLLEERPNWIDGDVLSVHSRGAL